MKVFEAPEMDIVYFEQTNLIVTSLPCECDECTNCEEGSNDCHCVDSWSSDYRPSQVRSTRKRLLRKRGRISMTRKVFLAPSFEVVKFNQGIMTVSNCGCFDAMFCPVNYSNCTNDGADCECQVNHVAGTANCTPCGAFNG